VAGCLQPLWGGVPLAASLTQNKGKPDPIRKAESALQAFESSVCGCVFASLTLKGQIMFVSSSSPEYYFGLRQRDYVAL
jgi:hypothetical protein